MEHTPASQAARGQKHRAKERPTLQTDLIGKKKKTLTHKLGRPKDVFEFRPSFYFVRQSKVYEFDAG